MGAVLLIQGNPSYPLSLIKRNFSEEFFAANVYKVITGQPFPSSKRGPQAAISLLLLLMIRLLIKMSVNWIFSKTYCTNHKF